jgi:murein DD-endopeptidase MepM/ murein hydrolase activator NlpD
MPGKFAHVFHDIPFLARIAGHVGLLALVSGAVLVGQVPFDFRGATSRSFPVVADPFQDVGFGGPELTDADLPIAPNPLTLIPKRTRKEIVKYRVRAGDTVSDIAQEFDLKPETIMWANAQLADDPDMLTIGEVLTILPVNGVYHTIATGDTIQSIAKKHSADPNAILGFELNQLNVGESLPIGQGLIVPGGKKLIVQKQVRAYSGAIPHTAARGTGNFGWPVSGVITQKYWAFHQGIDIGAPIGTPVKAADSGFVMFAGWDNTGFGRMILIDHGNGYVTLYGHLDRFAMAAGDSVKKGQLIGRVGNTGRSTGPHLDFRIRQGGAWRNPFGFLR